MSGAPAGPVAAAAGSARWRRSSWPVWSPATRIGGPVAAALLGVSGLFGGLDHVPLVERVDAGLGEQLLLGGGEQVIAVAAHAAQVVARLREALVLEDGLGLLVGEAEGFRIEQRCVGRGCGGGFGGGDGRGHEDCSLGSGWALRKLASAALNIIGRSRLARWPTPSSST